MEETQADLGTSLDQLVADVAALTTASAANTAAVAALLAKIQSGTPPIDLTAEIQRVSEADQAVKDAVSAITASDASAA